MRRARARFAQNLRGEGRGDFGVDLLTQAGEDVRVEISSVPLRSGHRAIGMLDRRPAPGGARPSRRLDGRLTERQHEILGLWQTANRPIRSQRISI